MQYKKYFGTRLFALMLGGLISVGMVQSFENNRPLVVSAQEGGEEVDPPETDDREDDIDVDADTHRELNQEENTDVPIQPDYNIESGDGLATTPEGYASNEVEDTSELGNMTPAEVKGLRILYQNHSLTFKNGQSVSFKDIEEAMGTTRFGAELFEATVASLRVRDVYGKNEDIKGTLNKSFRNAQGELEELLKKSYLEDRVYINNDDSGQYWDGGDAFYAVADVNIGDIKKDMVAHQLINSKEDFVRNAKPSQEDTITDKVKDLNFTYQTPKGERVVGKDALEFSPVDGKPIYQATLKILNEVGREIDAKGNPDVEGTLNIYTYQAPTYSATLGLNEFMDRYPNVKVNVYFNQYNTTYRPDGTVRMPYY